MMNDDRRMTADRFYGGVDDRLENLQAMLRFVADDSPTEDELMEWFRGSLGASSQSTLDTYLRFVRQLKLVERDDVIYRITSEGTYFLETRDTDLLYEKLTDIVKGCEEILVILDEGSLSLSEITSQLRPEFPDYSLPEGVVIKHVEWLECIGYIERDGEDYVLTERGSLAVESEIELPEFREHVSEGALVSDQEKPGRGSLRKRAEKDSVETAIRRTVTRETTEYRRSSAVRQYVKDRADGVCEGCGEPAPFTSRTGEPYLQAHHVEELSEGGFDSPSSVVALCPNCHYRVHHGEDGEGYNERLTEMVKDLER